MLWHCLILARGAVIVLQLFIYVQQKKNVPISVVSFEILAYLPDQSVWMEKGVSTLEHPTLSDHRAHMIWAAVTGFCKITQCSCQLSSSLVVRTHVCGFFYFILFCFSEWNEVLICRDATSLEEVWEEMGAAGKGSWHGSYPACWAMPCTLSCSRCNIK